MTKRSDESWRQFVLNSLPVEMEANTGPAAAGLPSATPSDFGPITFRGDRTPSDPAELLDGLPSARVKATSIHQRALDLHAQIPSHEQVQEVRLEVVGYKNRIADLTRHKSEGGFGLDASAPQVVSEKRKLERAEKELARLTELKEIRTVRWSSAGRLHQSVSDWVLRGIPGGCALEPVEDAPLSELLTKADNGLIDAAIERFRHRQRELAADLHRVRSSPWPSSVAKAAARELIDRLADQGAPNLDAAIEHGMPISFAQMTLRSTVRAGDAMGVAHVETVDSFSTLCWLLKDQMQAKIDAGFDEIADDRAALSQAQREEVEAQISADMLAIERAECGLIWIAESRGEVLDFRSETSPMAALGIALQIVPRADQPQTSWMHSYDIVEPGGGRR